MYLNTFLYLFGLDPDNFINEVVEPVETDDGKITYNLRQRIDQRMCPRCGKSNAIIKDYNWTETSLTTNGGKPTYIRIKKVRFICKECRNTFTPKIRGIDRYSKISNQVENLIIKEFYKQKSFSIIANDYQLSNSQVMKLFDKSFPNILRDSIPKTLCIDEIGFKTDEGSYAAIIYDHDRKCVCDVIKSRQLDYLRSYFNHCSFKERNEVKYFISDLYEGYATIKEEYFHNAIHIADMFHIQRLLKMEITKLRVNTYKQFTDEGDPERGFMKQHWDYFERYLDAKLAHKPYFCKKEKVEVTTWHMMERCLRLNQTFWDAYACLQDFYEYRNCRTFEQGLKFVERIRNKLVQTEKEELVRVGETYFRWRVEIANAITCKNVDGKRFSNGPAEGLNNAIKTLIKDANGYKNFERFRKRILLLLGKRKDPSR